MEKRPYLRLDDRRRQLLDAASRLLVRDGLLGITMVAVAAEAGVSRRLVYDHFGDLPGLFEAFFEDRSTQYLDLIDAAVAANDGSEPAVTSAYAQLLELPPEDQAAVRLLVAGPGVPDLEPVRQRVRSHIEERWLPRLPAPETARARAVLWTLVGGLLALAELVARRELTPDEALELATTLGRVVPGSLAAVPVPTTH